jgi:hypothetical protein
LKNDEGTLVWLHEEKEMVLYNHYRGVPCSKLHRRLTIDWSNLNLSRVDDPDLNQPFTLEELKRTVDELPAEKAPGPDGFNGLFYKRCWDVIKLDILSAMNCFYEHRAGPLERMNGAIIVLIRKTQRLNIPRTTGRLALSTRSANS